LQDDGTSSRQQQPVFDATRNGVAPLAEGEPIAVATTPANELFAIDARRSVVVKWDAQRRPERVIGGFGQRRGRLQHPVDLALDANRLYVADRERASILVYDLLGTYRRSIRLSDRTRLAAARGLAVDSGRLWIATGSQVVTVSTGAVGQRVAAEIDAPIVDLAVRRPDLYVLTESRLLRLAGAARTTADD
jgi:outer membrane protein assembly factor BamB